MLNVETFLLHDVENKEIYPWHVLFKYQIKSAEEKKEHPLPDSDIISLNTICKSTGKTVDWIQNFLKLALASWKRRRSSPWSAANFLISSWR